MKKEEDAPALTETDVVEEIREASGHDRASETLNSYASGLCLSDDTLLALLWYFADPVARHVIHAIRTRKLYRRVAVLSASRDKKRYQQIYGPFRTDIDRGHLRNIETMREQCEQRVLSTLRRKLAATPELLPPNASTNDILTGIDRVKPLV